MGSAAGAIGSVVGGLIGAGSASGDFGTARSSADQAYQQLLQMGEPPETAKALVLQQFSSQGTLTPELEQYIQAGPSAVSGITEDPALKEKQMSALELLSQRASGGLNPEDRAAFNELREQTAREQNAKQQQIIQNMQARGMGGSGAELQAALLSQQAGANQASRAGDDLAATASRNALQAALQSGQLGGQIRQQDFDVNKTKASATDEMNRFNIQNKMAQQARNVGAKNRAQEYNLNQAQEIADSNVSLANKETMRQNQAKMDDYNAKLGLAKAKSNTLLDKAEDFQKRGQRTTDQIGQIGSAIGQGAAAYFSGGASELGNKTAGGAADNPSKYSNMASQGGLVPGTAFMKQDSPINDVVDAKLSPGEIVLPRSIMESHDPGDVAKKFVQYVQALNKKPDYKYGKGGK